MCGRFTLAPPEPTLRELIGPAEWRVPYTARWNVAPGQDVLTVLALPGGERVVAPERWGFPTGDGSAVMVNARAETAATRSLFRHAWSTGRCIVPADSFYEWQGKGGQPWRVRLRDAGVFGLAAIRSDDGGLAILTVDAAPALAGIHHRMPAMLATPESWRAWLAGGDGLEQGELFEGADAAFLVHPVSRRVNSVLNDDPACAAEAPPEPRQMTLF